MEMPDKAEVEYRTVVIDAVELVVLDICWSYKLAEAT